MASDGYLDERELINALKRIEGQARGIQAMIGEHRDCAEVVQQLSALRNAVDRVGHRLVASNLKACLAEVEVSSQVRAKLERGLLALGALRS